MRMLCIYMTIFTILQLICGCNKNFTKFPVFHIQQGKKIPSINNLPPVNFAKESLLEVRSISTVDRYHYGGGGNAWIPKVRVTSLFKDTTFNRVVRYINKIESSGAFKVSYQGSNKNDSVYSSIINDSFLNQYHHLMMQEVDFKNYEQDGIYLIVTYILNKTQSFSSNGISGGGGSWIQSNTLYEFFRVKKGVAVEYTGFSLGRDSIWRSGSRKYFIKPKEVRLVFKKLYAAAKKTKQ